MGGLKQPARVALRVAAAYGWDVLAALTALRETPGYWARFFSFRRRARASGWKGSLRPDYPCLNDRRASGGSASGHYFHQDLLVARRVFERKPERHVDVGSRVDGFVAHVAVFRPIEVLDVRPIRAVVPNVTFRQADLMSLPPDLEGAADSVSCLHALEHFGLGRYGDPLDPEGHRKGFDSLVRILRPRGILYLSVPIGPERVEFDAHRVLSVRTVLDMALGRLDLEAFSFVDDKGGLHENVPMTDAEADRSFGQRYGCGIFEFRKR